MLFECAVSITFDYRSRDTGAPLLNAVGSSSDDRLQIVKLLIDRGADIDCVNNTGNDALSCAVYASFERDDSIELIEYLEQNGADIYKNYSGENTLLHKACERDSLLIIKYLVKERSFDVNKQNSDGDTALIHFLRFASAREKETLSFLLESGADPQIKNKDGKSAYDYALELHPEFAELLK